MATSSVCTAPTIDTGDREAAIRLYRELLQERDALARQLEWLRAQLPASEEEADGPMGSDLLFLADYARMERHLCVRGLDSARRAEGEPKFELAVRQRMEKMSTVLWPSGCVLAEVVAHELGDLCKSGAPILELGCGTAVPSIVAAALGAEVLATDADVTSADLVIDQNQSALDASTGSISTSALEWGCPVPPKPWAAVLAADVLYDEAWHAPLASTLASVQRQAQAAGRSDATRILLAYQVRRPAVEGRFFSERLPEVGLIHHNVALDAIPMSDNMRSCIKVVDVTPAHLGILAAVVADVSPRPQSVASAADLDTGLYL